MTGVIRSLLRDTSPVPASELLSAESACAVSHSDLRRLNLDALSCLIDALAKLDPKASTPAKRSVFELLCRVEWVYRDGEGAISTGARKRLQNAIIEGYLKEVGIARTHTNPPTQPLTHFHVAHTHKTAKTPEGGTLVEMRGCVCRRHRSYACIMVGVRWTRSCASWVRPTCHQRWMWKWCYRTSLQVHKPTYLPTYLPTYPSHLPLNAHQHLLVVAVTMTQTEEGLLLLGELTVTMLHLAAGVCAPTYLQGLCSWTR
jgi:hypothetical protein